MKLQNNEDLLAEIQAKISDGEPAAAFENVIAFFTESKDYHRLFQALMMQARQKMGLPLLYAASADEVPDGQLDEFEKLLIAAARNVGELFLEDGNLVEAWPYFKHIGEQDAFRQSLEQHEIDPEDYEGTEKLIEIALHEQAHPVRGFQWMLASHGICNTITTLEQSFHNLSAEERAEVAGLLVDHVHSDLCNILKQEIEHRESSPLGEGSLRDWLTDERNWLFENANYHLDVSHLHAVIRFAQSLQRVDIFEKVLDLAEYGSRLDEQFRYPADPPFEDFYQASIHYFKLLKDPQNDDSWIYFRETLKSAEEAADKMACAQVLVELSMRADRFDDALDVALENLSDEQLSFRDLFQQLCEKTGRWEDLAKIAKTNNDILTSLATGIEQNKSVGTS